MSVRSVLGEIERSPAVKRPDFEDYPRGGKKRKAPKAWQAQLRLHSR